jgi:hypothetical protein
MMRALFLDPEALARRAQRSTRSCAELRDDLRGIFRPSARPSSS